MIVSTINTTPLYAETLRPLSYVFTSNQFHTRNRYKTSQLQNLQEYGQVSSDAFHIHQTLLKLRINSNLDEVNPRDQFNMVKFRLYVKSLRPITVLQAIGAFLVGTLTILRSSSYSLSPLPTHSFIQLCAATSSIFLSYGAGMVMNDAIDADIDSQQNASATKKDRPIASGQISKRNAWIYSGLLSVASVLIGGLINRTYALWTITNLSLMLGYAIILQKVLLVKNAVCGWLAISPLIGSLLFSSSIFVHKTIPQESINQLVSLAFVGFLMHISREIVKDIEDVDLDRGIKSTLPVVFGENLSHRIAYGIVGITYALNIFTPTYRGIFASSIYLYPISIAITLPMCVKASMMSISEGQKLLKKSIYILLAGMIGTLIVK